MTSPAFPDESAQHTYWVPVRDDNGIVQVQAVSATCPGDALELAEWPPPERTEEGARER
jgi:hypothetical protein